MAVSAIYFWFSFALGLIAVAPYLSILHRLEHCQMTIAAGSGLVIAAIVYLGFALQQGETRWLLIELAGVVTYGLAFLLALRYSILFLAAGWGLHPLWDIFVHWQGPGTHLAPVWYAIACLSFDLAVSGYLFWRYHLQHARPGAS